VPHHEPAEVADKERRGHKRRQLADNRDLQHRVKGDDTAFQPVQHHELAEIPSEEQHAHQRNEVRDDEGDRRLGRKWERHLGGGRTLLRCRS